jgi:cysteine desulfurase/selenocysteine lyase
MSIDVAQIRKDFPILATKMRERPLVYLDTAAQCPETEGRHRRDLGLLRESLREHPSRRLSALGRRDAALQRGPLEGREVHRRAGSARDRVRPQRDRSGQSRRPQLGRRADRQGRDEIVVTTMEHHANIVPWQMLAARKEARLRVATIHEDGTLDVAQLEGLLGPRTRLLAFTHVSNVLGTINPVAEITAMARARGITTLVDGAQGVPHGPVDVAALGCDFYVFSGHKLFGPTGAGVLYGRYAILDAMPPFLGGGDMIERVSFKGTTYARAPERFEAGTPDIASVVGLGAAIDYLEGIGMANIAAYEHTLLVQATDALSKVPGLRIVGTAKQKAAVVAFVLDGVHPHDIGTVLDGEGIAIPRGPPLRAAPDGAPRPPRDGPGLLRLLQHRGRDRSTGRGPREDPRAVRLRNGKARGTGIGRSA